MHHSLIVEDNPADAELLMITLEASGFESTFEVVSTIAEALDRLSNVDIVFCDLSLPDASNVSSVFDLRFRDVDVPVIVVSGHQLGDEVTSWGADGFVFKDALRGRGCPKLRRLVEQTIAKDGDPFVWAEPIPAL